MGRTHYVEPLQGAGLTVVRMVLSGPPLLCALGLVEETREPWSFPELRRGPGEAERRLTVVEQGQTDHVFEGMRAAGKSPPDPAWYPGSDGFQFPQASGPCCTGYTLELPGPAAESEIEIARGGILASVAPNVQVFVFLFACWREATILSFFWAEALAFFSPWTAHHGLHPQVSAKETHKRQRPLVSVMTLFSYEGKLMQSLKKN